MSEHKYGRCDECTLHLQVTELTNKLNEARLERGNKVAMLLLDIADEQLKVQELTEKLAAAQALSDSYIQTVPDKCDRIIWRNRYYMLPLNIDTLLAAAKQEGDKEGYARAINELAESEPVCYWYPLERRYFSAEDAAKYFDEKEIKLTVPLYTRPTAIRNQESEPKEQS